MSPNLNWARLIYQISPIVNSRVRLCSRPSYQISLRVEVAIQMDGPNLVHIFEPKKAPHSSPKSGQAEPKSL